MNRSEVISWQWMVFTLSLIHIYFGLCTYGNKESETYGERKPVYDVFRYIDTQRTLEFSEKYLSDLGVTSWNSLIYGLDVYKRQHLNTAENISVTAYRD